MIDPSLLDPSAIGQSLRALATRVDRGGDPNSADRLRLLGEAVEKKSPSAQAWVASDISKVIDPDSIVEHYRQRHATVPGCLLEMIEAARNVFIFAPIIVTWLGISQATAKYNDYIGAALAKHDNTQLSQPFLYLWQQGFGGRLASWLTLSNVALIDVIILISIFFLTLLAHTISNSNRLSEEGKARELYSDLVHTIGRATLCLHTGQAQPQPQLVGGSVNKLDQVALDIQNMASTIMATFNKLENDLMTRFNGIVNNLSSQFNQITKDLSVQLQQGGQYLGTLGATAKSLQQLTQEMRNAAQDLTNANKEMTKSVNALLGPATDLAQQQQNLLQSVDKSVALLQDNADLLRDNADELKDFSKKQTSLGSDLVISLDAVRDASTKMDDLVMRLGDSVTQQDSLVAEMKNERAAQTRLADNMTQAMLSTQDVQKYLRDLAIDFRQIAVDTNEVLRLYAGLPKNLGTDMARAMLLIEKGGGDLSSAAMSIFSASQFFEKVVADQEQVIDRLKASNKI